MSRQLPVPIQNKQESRSLAVPGQQTSTSSPLVRLAVALAPDILRAAEQVVLKRVAEPARKESAPVLHGQSMHLSEVEIDTSLPFVRRVTIRNASAWSTFPATPEPVTPEGPSFMRKTGRFLGVSGAAALVTAVMVRRFMPGGRIIDVQGRQRD